MCVPLLPMVHLIECAQWHCHPSTCNWYSSFSRLHPDLLFLSRRLAGLEARADVDTALRRFCPANSLPWATEKAMNSMEKLHPNDEEHRFGEMRITACKHCGKRLFGFGVAIHHMAGASSRHPLSVIHHHESLLYHGRLRAALIG